MQFQIATLPLPSWKGDCAILFGVAPVGDPAPAFTLPASLTHLDETLWGGALIEVIQDHNFQGKAASVIATRTGADIRKLVLVGLGDPTQLTLEGIRRATAAGLRQAHSLKAKQVSLLLPDTALPLTQVVRAMTEAGLLVAHQDQRFKSSKGTESNGFTVQTATILLPDASDHDLAGAAAALQEANPIAAGTILARELVAAPANIVTPITLAQTARDLAQQQGMDVEVLGYEECAALGMGAFLGVAQASDLPPQFIHLTYRPDGDPLGKVALIGKGLTFDSGGLNIKTDSRSIAMMKTDMGGAAAVLGAAHAIAALKPKLEVHFIVAATENMISGHAIHPGDILTASNQKTIEINNTDAEGRLTLADALVFAEKLEVDAIVDLATLTGACVIALGEEIGGLFSPNDALAQQIQAASQRSGEKLWRMPMEEGYFEGLSSGVADMKNTGPRPGGSITASLFLKQFVNKTPWAHLDIAGPVWSERDHGYINKGATGFGVRLLVEWVMARQTMPQSA
ncbi:MAG: leucyl aminopeptidase [Cyanobacteriota bacterium]|nr:leucyl aminopeptidase [Cyanobacteriota bacterium]